MRAGEEIDGWLLIEPLGSGGNAEVWEAERSDFGRVALKVLRVRNRASERFLRFRREVGTLRDLGERPGILPILDWRLPEDRSEPAWLAMPVFVGDVARAIGVTPYLGGMGTPAAHTGIVTELSYPPFTYTLTVGSPPLEQAGCRITHFADLDDTKQEVKLRLPVGWTLVPELTPS